MKANYLKTITVGLMILSLWSCKKDEVRVVANASAAGTLTASNTTVNLNSQNAEQTAVTFTFPEATVTGYPVAVTSTLQFDLKGNNFTRAKEVVLDTTAYSTTVSELNKMLLSLGAQIGTAVELEVRLKSAPAPNAPTYSNVITISGTPYLASTWVYVPGDYNGWKPETADSLISVNADSIYTGMIDFTPGNLGFKITAEKSWTVEYGDAGEGKITTSGGGNFSAMTAGIKQVTLDLTTNTWKIEEPTTWGVIGDATPKGWDGDTNMKVTNDGKGIYTVKVDLVEGKFKFRYNHDWGVNLGGSGGTLTDGGGDISVATAGNYTITLNAEAKTYTIVKN
jgi:hypothetical protein